MRTHHFSHLRLELAPRSAFLRLPVFTSRRQFFVYHRFIYHTQSSYSFVKFPSARKTHGGEFPHSATVVKTIHDPRKLIIWFSGLIWFWFFASVLPHFRIAPGTEWQQNRVAVNRPDESATYISPFSVGYPIWQIEPHPNLPTELGLV